MQRLQYSFGEYVGGFDEKTQRRHGYGVILYLSGNSYEGEWNQGSMHGEGRKKYANSDLYEGEWRDGKRQGKGRYRYHQGHVYEGQYFDDNCHGLGKLTLAHGAGSYEGEWENGVKHGRGIERNRSNVYYDGEFANGMKHGVGKLIEEKVVENHEKKNGSVKRKDDDGNDNDDNDSSNIHKVVLIEHVTTWHEGEQTSGTKLESIEHHPSAAAGGGRQPHQRGPIADKATLEALEKAGVAPEAIRALGQFSMGVERSFGALDTGVAGMEAQINNLVGTLEAVMAGMDLDGEDENEEGEEEADDDDDDEGLDYK